MSWGPGRDESWPEMIGEFADELIQMEGIRWCPCYGRRRIAALLHQGKEDQRHGGCPRPQDIHGIGGRGRDLPPVRSTSPRRQEGEGSRGHPGKRFLKEVIQGSRTAPWSHRRNPSRQTNHHPGMSSLACLPIADHGHVLVLADLVQSSSFVHGSRTHDPASPGIGGTRTAACGKLAGVQRQLVEPGSVSGLTHLIALIFLRPSVIVREGQRVDVHRPRMVYGQLVVAEEEGAQPFPTAVPGVNSAGRCAGAWVCLHHGRRDGSLAWDHP